MLKGFVSGEEKDIKRIPMKGKNLFDGSGISTNVKYVSVDSIGQSIHFHGTALSSGGRLQAITSDIVIEAGTYRIKALGQQSIQLFLQNKGDSTKYYRFDDASRVITLETRTTFFISCGVVEGTQYDETISIMLNAGSQPLPYEPYGYQEGWEVRDNQDRLIWGREDELQTATGTLPFKGYALPVKVKSLLGNAVQNGTPSPQNIVTLEMCGVRTGNLHNPETDVFGFIDTNGNISPLSVTKSTDFIPCVSGQQYVLRVYKTGTLQSTNKRTVDFYLPDRTYIELPWGERVTYALTADEEYHDIPFVVPTGASFLRFCYDIGYNKSMLNLGSTALPYEPFGWKVPFENRGENLLDESASSDADATHINYNKGTPVILTAGQTYTFSCNASCNGLYIRSSADDSNLASANNSSTLTYTPQVNVSAYFRIWNSNGITNLNPMLSLGSTPKPYSPYLNAIIPVYLGEVPTVRKVKKLVLTGAEGWSPETTNVFTIYATMPKEGYKNLICTHYGLAASYSDLTSKNNVCAVSKRPALFIKDSRFTTSADFKTYLASEYAAGHPVTVWYAIETEQTGISNEPLCKISTYADELTTIQAHGLSAPLYGIGDYKDTLNLSTGVVTRKVKKLVLDGTEEWVFAGDVARTIYLTLTGTYKAMDNSPAICTHYVEAASGDRIMITGDGRYLRIYDSSRRYANVDAWKTFLAQQYANGAPVIIWYILATTSTETVTVPTGMTGEIEGYLTQVGTPTPTNRSVPKWNGVEETGGTYAVTVYTPPEIPTTTGQNTLTVDSNLAPSKLEVSVHAKKIHYGFKIDKSNDDSESAVIYTHDAVTMTPAHMDFTNDRFDYGSWGNAFFVRDCYPVALNLDGTIAYRLDPDDYTKKTDGTASDIFYELLATAPSDWSTQWKQYYTKSGDEYVLNDQGSAPTFATDTYYKLTYNSSFTGNFMMAFPKVWFYRHEDSQYNYIEISNYKLSDDWKCYAHINASGQEVDFIYLPLFKGVIVNSKLRSLPGQIPQGNTTATDEVNAATALGSRWQIWDHSSVECLNDLLTLMSKSIDSQGRYGAGRSNAYNASDTVTYGKLQSGTLIKKGKFHGYSSGYKDVKVFGIESLWANRYDRIQGLLLANGVWKVKMTPPYNFTGTDFVTLSSASVPADVGYLSRVQTSEYGSIPAATISTSGKYFKDYFYKYANDTCVPLRGGNCADTDIAGYRFIYAGDPAWRTAWSFGASPVYK